jgi:hypothetical protein
MKSKAATVEQYLASLPDDRRAAVSVVRRFILDHLDKDFRECMQYGVIGYCVPHSGEGGWPHGHHTNPKLPLMYMGLSSQKNDMVVYMLFLLHNKPERERFDRAWRATGKKNYLEVSGAGCCLRFKKLADLSLDVIGETMRRMPAKKYLEDHVAMLARLGKGPDGKPIKRGAGGRDPKQPAPRSRRSAAHSNTTTRNTRASSRVK